jgi:crotonobetainyl-CoA:carnitine CoA-transferase CaiB-like acyl-CoA transferase
LAGKVLAELGACVLKIEPPEGGCSSRLVPPFDEAGSSRRSLYWEFVAMGKRSVALDLRDDDDLVQVRGLLARADIFIESFDPGFLSTFGLDYGSVRDLNPGLVYVSVTPFGQTGPDASSPATEVTIEAASGLLSLQGDGDRPPLPVGFPQAAFHAGAQAAADALIALYERDRSGQGQYLDLSMQAAMVWTLLYANGIAALTGCDPHPAGPSRRQARLPELLGVFFPSQLVCKDGHVVVSLGLGRRGSQTLQSLVAWMDDEDALDPALRGVCLQTWPRDVRDGRLAASTVQRLVDLAATFVKGKTMRELMDRACRDRLLLAPAVRVADLVDDRQLTARAFWRDIDGRRYPGPFAVLSQTPSDLRGAPDPVGEGQSLADEVLGRPAPTTVPARPRTAAFAGLKVADFSWAAVGPLIAKALADHGATVVRVESSTRVDLARTLPPFRDGIPGLNRSQAMALYNTSKLSVSVNLATPEGRELAARLGCWADVVIENFSPGVMTRLGLDYDRLRTQNDGLVMLSTSIRGSTGPERDYRGFGPQGAALAGLHAITGWPDRPPTGPWGAYSDLTTPRLAVAALVAALRHRDRTGTGQHIDVSQVEATIPFIGPLVLDYVWNGRVAGPRGHRSDRACPHGVYQAAGQERYVTVAVETEQQWIALCSTVAMPKIAPSGPDHLQQRLARSAELDEALGGWIRTRDPWQAAAELKSSGVPASVVLRPSDLFDDPQLAHRGFFVTLNHPEMGPTPYEGFPTDFSATPPLLRSAAPCLGEHTDQVLHHILGLNDKDIARYAMTGALE